MCSLKPNVLILVSPPRSPDVQLITRARQKVSPTIAIGVTLVRVHVVCAWPDGHGGAFEALQPDSITTPT